MNNLETASLTEEQKEVLLLHHPILEQFTYAHLPPSLQSSSKPFAVMAWLMASVSLREPRPGHWLAMPNEELTAGLRKLLEAKDCYVRAYKKLLGA